MRVVFQFAAFLLLLVQGLDGLAQYKNLVFEGGGIRSIGQKMLLYRNGYEATRAAITAQH